MDTGIKNFMERMKETEIVSYGELSEIRWQAAIIYAQKYYKARNERNHPVADYNKIRAITEASKVWQYLGFTENEVIEHKLIFTNTILSKGGTYESVGDYFMVLHNENKMSPKALLKEECEHNDLVTN